MHSRGCHSLSHITATNQNNSIDNNPERGTGVTYEIGVTYETVITYETRVTY